MGVDEFSISLDKTSREYSPGESMTGKVVLKVSGSEPASELLIRFFGAVNAYWEDPLVSDRHNHAIHHHYHGHEVLFQRDVSLLGNGETRLELPVGSHTYSFKFKVPTTPLPASCSFGYTGVAYGLEGIIRNPFYAADIKSETLPITIITTLDLNMIPGAEDPVETVEIKPYRDCCCFSSYQASCTIRTFTPKLGFCVGEVIPFIVEIDNASNRNCSKVTATFIQLWAMTAFNLSGGRVDHRENPVTLQTENYDKDVKSGEAIKWEINFAVPLTVPPTQLPGASEIISLDYVISVGATMEGRRCEGTAKRQVEVSHPVTVGTIPLQSSTARRANTPEYYETGGLA